MARKSFVPLSVSNIEITPELARFGETCYPIANIGAVSVSTKKIGYRLGGVFLCVIGVLVAAFTESPWWLILSLLGFASLFKSPDYEFTLILATSSGNRQAFTTRDKAEFDEVRSSLEAAIIARGRG